MDNGAQFDPNICSVPDRMAAELHEFRAEPPVDEVIAEVHSGDEFVHHVCAWEDDDRLYSLDARNGIKSPLRTTEPVRITAPQRSTLNDALLKNGPVLETQVREPMEDSVEAALDSRNGLVLEAPGRELTEDSVAAAGEWDPLIKIECKRNKSSRTRLRPAGPPAGHQHMKPEQATSSKKAGVKDLKTITFRDCNQGQLVEHARVTALKENRAMRLRQSREWHARCQMMKEGMFQWCAGPQLCDSPRGPQAKEDNAMRGYVPAPRLAPAPINGYSSATLVQELIPAPISLNVISI